MTGEFNDRDREQRLRILEVEMARRKGADEAMSARLDQALTLIHGLDQRVLNINSQIGQLKNEVNGVVAKIAAVTTFSLVIISAITVVVLRMIIGGGTP